jgi:hypothetical protein
LCTLCGYYALVPPGTDPGNTYVDHGFEGFETERSLFRALTGRCVPQ